MVGEVKGAHGVIQRGVWWPRGLSLGFDDGCLRDSFSDEQA